MLAVEAAFADGVISLDAHGSPQAGTRAATKAVVERV